MSERSLRSITLGACLAALLVLLAVNARYVYSDELDRLPQLTAGHIADPRFAGATFAFTGRVTSAGRSAQGITFIDVQQPEQDLNINVPVFPSVGSPPLRPRRGDVVRITGNLGMYEGRPQIKPLSAAHVEVLTRPAADELAPPLRAWDGSAAAIPLAVAATRLGATLHTGPLTATAVEPFTSRAGRRHVRLTLADADSAVQAILYEGDWTDAHVALLESGASIVVTAEIDEYRGQPSLVIRQIHTLDGFATDR